MDIRTINLLNSVEIENITAETVTLDNITATHYNDLKVLIDLLTAEKKAYDRALCEKAGHETFKSNMLSVSVYDSFDFNKDEFIADYDAETYNKYRTKKKHTEKVIRFGK